MHSRADLQQLSHEQKDELILALQAQLVLQQEQIAALQQMVVALQARLNLNSANSSKPPSTDGLMRPKPKSLRKSGGRATGGQEGHPGQTLRGAATPDRVVTHAPPLRCDACQRTLGAAQVVETRQVFELPLNQHHMVPVKRTATLMDELFGLKVSQATVVKAADQAAARLSPPWLPSHRRS